MGRHERKKKEKRRRIKQAARKLFQELGYSSTTTRAISDRADVGTGTLFTYYRDKTDLLLAVFSEDLDQVIADAAPEPGDAPVGEAINQLLTPLYQHLAEDVDLSRAIIKEMLVPSEGNHPEAEAVEARLQLQLTRLIERAKDRGEIDAGHDTGGLTHLVQAVHQHVLLRWLRQPTPVTEPLERLRRFLGLLLDGLGPRAR